MNALRPSNGSETGAGRLQPAAPMVPFIVGSVEGVAQGAGTLNYTLSTSQQITNNIEIPPAGWLRGVWVNVQATSAGNSANVAFRPDGVFTALANLRLSDISSAPLFGELTGFQAYLANLLGGYWPTADPTQYRMYSAVTGSGGSGGSFAFQMWIPAEAILDGMGSLENMAANSTFRVNLTVAALTEIYATAPTVAPTVQITFTPEHWNKPASSYMGAAVAPTPPLPGTTQYWTRNTISYAAAGAVQAKFQRVGMSLRTVIFEFRDASGVRLTDATMPSLLEYAIDNKVVKSAPVAWWINNTAQRAQLAGTTQLPSGVVALSFSHAMQGRSSLGDSKSLWLPTGEGSLHQLRFSAPAAGSLNILTNDLAVQRGQ